MTSPYRVQLPAVIEEVSVLLAVLILTQHVPAKYVDLLLHRSCDGEEVHTFAKDLSLVGDVSLISNAPVNRFSGSPR